MTPVLPISLRHLLVLGAAVATGLGGTGIVRAEDDVHLDLLSGGHFAGTADHEVFFASRSEEWSLVASAFELDEKRVVRRSGTGFAFGRSTASGRTWTLGAKGREEDDDFGVETESWVLGGVETRRFSLGAGFDLGNGGGAFLDARAHLGDWTLRAFGSERARRREIGLPAEVLAPRERLRYFGILESRGDRPLQPEVPLSVAGAGVEWAPGAHLLSLEVRDGDQETAGGREVSHTGLAVAHSFDGRRVDLESRLETDEVAEVLRSVRFVHSGSYDFRWLDAELGAFLGGETTELSDVLETASRYGGAFRVRFGGSGLRLGPFVTFERDRERTADVVQGGLSMRRRETEILVGLVLESVGRPRFEEETEGVFVGGDLDLGILVQRARGWRLRGTLGWEGSTTHDEGGAWGTLGLTRGLGTAGKRGDGA